MIITIKQGTKDTKNDFLNMLENLETLGFVYFDGGSYDKNKQLAEATMIYDKDIHKTNNENLN